LKIFTKVGQSKCRGQVFWYVWKGLFKTHLCQVWELLMYWFTFSMQLEVFTKVGECSRSKGQLFFVWL